MINLSEEKSIIEKKCDELNIKSSTLSRLIMESAQYDIESRSLFKERVDEFKADVYRDYLVPLKSYDEQLNLYHDYVLSSIKSAEKISDLLPSFNSEDSLNVTKFKNCLEEIAILKKGILMSISKWNNADNSHGELEYGQKTRTK